MNSGQIITSVSSADYTFTIWENGVFDIELDDQDTAKISFLNGNELVLYSFTEVHYMPYHEYWKQSFDEINEYEAFRQERKEAMDIITDELIINTDDRDVIDMSTAYKGYVYSNTNNGMRRIDGASIGSIGEGGEGEGVVPFESTLICGCHENKAVFLNIVLEDIFENEFHKTEE